MHRTDARRDRKRRLVLVALAAAAALLLGACTSGGLIAVRDVSGRAQVGPDGGSARLETAAGTWEVTVPAGAVATTGTLTLDELPDRGALTAGAGIAAVGGVGVRLSQGQPAAPLGLRLTVPEPIPADLVAVVMHVPDDDVAGDALPAVISADRRTLTAELPHLSDFFAFVAQVVDTVRGNADGIARAVGGVLGERAEPPRCEARPRWLDDAIYVDDSDGARNTPLLTCVGADPDDPQRLAVKIANNRSTGLVVTTPVDPAWTWFSSMSGIADVGIGLSSWVVERLSLGPASRTFVVAPGEQLHLGFTQESLRSVGGPVVVQGSVGQVAALLGMVHQLFEGSVGDPTALSALELAVLGRCALDAMVDPLGDATWNRLLRSTGSVLACIASNAGAVVDVLVERLPASIWNRWKGTIIDVGALARRAGVIGAITQATWNAGEFLAAMATDPSVYRVTIFLTPPPRRQLVLQMGGTVGDLGLYPSAEVATEHLREVLGPPTAERTGAFCDQGGGPGRVLEWDNFTVYLIDDASSLSPDVPGLEVSGPAMVGWSVSDWAPRRSGLRTAAGIGWGSTVAQVQQAYPGEEVQDRGIEWAFDIFRGDLSNLWITVGGPDPDERVVAMTSGFACPE